MLITIGENKETIDPWVNLIPNDYGLCIVKSGLLVLVKLAQRHTDKRRKVIDGFSEIHQVICNATLKRRSFQTDAQVCEAAGDLYVSIVDAIDELLDIVPSPSSISRLRSKLLKERNKNPIGKKAGIDEIMENIHNAVKKFEASVDTCRDQHIEATHVKANEVLHVSMRTSDQIRDLGDQSSNRFDKLDQGLLNCMNLLQTLLQSREDATDALRMLLSGLQKSNVSQAEQVIKKEQETQPSEKSERTTPINTQQQKAVISFKRLLQILSASAPDKIPVGNNDIELQNILAQRVEDLETVVNWSSRVDPSAQAQAYSILEQDRFLQWMRSEHPDMLLIDGNLSFRGASSIEKISAVSLFCAYFILSMTSLDSSHILLHFHCGLQCSPRDSWYGPTGLVRSVIMQVLVVLYDRGLLDLNILDRRSFVQALENHSLDELCIFLHQLIRQFPPDRTIVLVIDGISHFDLDLNGLFKKLAVVLECLQRIVEDDNLRPKFKVLMTSPTNSSWRLGRVVDKKYRLGLSSRRLAPLQLSQARMNVALGRGRPE
ncbi:uncharacterized protein TrAtP1_004736 [Trichoderma atroviride]|uniref:uncharacterized protein n=1 Tax=Hypocrea atroviridis TaxID=63577 RepID=UPI003331031F|nr:hypothetical protein TrAtP1_004736 [Trichoderma atroviride]